jgi:lipopolysaccharide biosynthesis protein
VYYPELWPELADRIERIPFQFTVATSLVHGRSDRLAPEINARFPGAVVRVVPNGGRDIAPMIGMLDLLDGHDVVLKLHTKRSPHMRNGDAWRRHLLDGVAASQGQIADILTLMATDARIGMVVPPGNVLGREFIGNNGLMLQQLATRGGRAFDARGLWFPAGSIFWARPDVLAPLGDLHLTFEDFLPETGAIDGTLPHAIERYLGVLALTQERAVVESSEVRALLGRQQVTGEIK